MTDSLSRQLESTLGPGFVLQRELGRGGMSRVFLFEERALARRVVVKVLSPELAAGVNIDRFRREILVVAGLQHPHIVPILSAGDVLDSTSPDANRLPWFSMPFVEGDSLRVRLERAGPLPVSEVVAILRDVAKGIAYAHAQRIIHRDIKPENILLSGGSAAITDFGVAKALSSAHRTGPGGDALTVIGMSLGTPAYMAPEQAAGDPGTDQRADIYSLGLLAYEMLAGRTPFGGRTVQALITAHVLETPPPVTHFRKDAPPALASLVMRCLEKDPSKRPQSAEELLASLDSTVAKHRTLGRPMLLAIAALALVVVMGIAWLGLRSTSDDAAGSGIAAIAVLPFVNTSGDARDEYFSDGMTDELTAALSRVEGLRVASRTSTFAFKGRHDADVREIGRRLGVGAVLEGTVRRDGRRVRLGAQLVNASDGLSLWSETFEREVEDIFEVQDEVASAIVAALAPRLGAADGAARGRRAAPSAGQRTSDLEAYDAYLRGRYHWHQRGDAALRTAATHFEQAIARDPRFAAAYAGLADVLALLPVYGTTPADSALPLARQAAERAIALDSTLAEAHTTLGLVHKSRGEWAESERVLLRALAIDPGSASAHQWHGELLVITGRLQEAASAMRRAHQLDPLSPVVAAELGYMLTLAGEVDAGIAMGRQAIDLAPDLWTGSAFLGSSYIFAGRPADAVPPLERAVQLAPEVSLFRGVLAYAYSQVNRQADARRIAEELSREIERGAPASPLAVAHIGLGEHDRALELLERAAGARDPFLLQMSLTPSWFDPVRGDPRFAGVARSLELDAAVMARRTGR